MFHHEGSERSDVLNRRVAGYLAFIGGFVNSTGFVLLGAFTSHMTGNVDRASLELASMHFALFATASSLVLMFFLGALGASLILESGRFGSTSRRYGIALAVEAMLLGAFGFTHVGALILCAAMGMQNSLVTRLSGAVVRTTHLTGVVTDLGIELSRWWRWSRDRNPARRPSPAKVGLLATIVSAFAIGAISGSALTVVFMRNAIFVPVLGLLVGAIYAVVKAPRLQHGVSVRDHSHHH